MRFPQTIQTWVTTKTYTENNVGMTQSRILVFDDMVLKIEETHEESNNEYQMLSWLQDKLRVPKIIQFAQENGYNYLLMSKIEGHMAFEQEIINNPTNMIHLLAEGIKQLWAVDVSTCPYRNDIDNKLRQARYRIDHNLIENDELDDTLFTSGRFKDIEDLYQYLLTNRPTEELVLSHGDYCLPNVLFKDNFISGFIDLGRSGIADKWQDIALCLRSMKYNLGDTYNETYLHQFLQELDIEYDVYKIDYYMLLDELF